MTRRIPIIIVVGMVAFAAIGCSKVSLDKVGKVIGSDIELQDQEALLDKYGERVAWTRMVIEDMKEREEPGEPKKKVIPRDTKVTIYDLNFAYNGAVVIMDKKRRKISTGLEIERPLTVAKIDSTLADMFWFEDPTMRHVAYIRMWGKKTARAVREHEVFIGMAEEAALESWGPPTQIRSNEIGDKIEQQWAYKRTKKPKYIYIVDGKVTKYEE